MASLLPDFFLLLAESRKNLNIMSCINVLDLVLKICSDEKEGNGIEVLFYLFVLMNIAASVLGMTFSQLRFRF